MANFKVIDEKTVALTRREAQALREHIEWLDNHYGPYEYVFTREETNIGYGRSGYCGIFCSNFIDFLPIVKITSAYKQANRNYVFTDRYVRGGQHEETIQILGLIKALEEVYTKLGTSGARKLARQ